MISFNFIETSFFISLGITFVLILLLIYHFKQRLHITENKQDTMFARINKYKRIHNNKIESYRTTKSYESCSQSMF